MPVSQDNLPCFDRFFGVLQRFREIAMGSRMLSNAALEAARLAQAQAEACQEAGSRDMWYVQNGHALTAQAGISDGDLKYSPERGRSDSS